MQVNCQWSTEGTAEGHIKIPAATLFSIQARLHLCHTPLLPQT